MRRTLLRLMHGLGALFVSAPYAIATAALSGRFSLSDDVIFLFAISLRFGLGIP